ncbi:MAG: vWA domain-containing protein [Gemmatimonas sp.]|jgi:Ca-activated chloride channel family protein|uniref:vWA domain-containing protein n=1 Tax=Gemmatimonas sp. TaxID=1962908 RepID=UPI00391F24E4|nr:VWA domain-containing protein [Gemmatimonadota bacterium]
METLLQVDHQVIESEQSPNGAGGTVVRALLSIAGHAHARDMRPPIGLALVLDRSGSMSGERIDAARVAAARAVDRLHPDEVVSVVAFDDHVQTVAAPRPRQQHHGLAAAVQAIDVRGSTNLSGGWLRGRQHMEQALGLLGSLPGSSRRVVLLTDGHANVGITEPATLIELARTARAMGITTTTVGIGEGYDDALLRAMADAGDGNAWYVEHPDQSHDVLAEALGNLLSVSAQGLTVTLSLGEAVSLFTVHSDWPVTSPSTGVFTFDLGDLYAAEPKPLLFELFVPAGMAEGLATVPTAIATISVSGDVMTASGGVEHRVVYLPLSATLDGQNRLQPEVEHAVLLARTAKAREEAARRQREGDAHGAQAAMLSARECLMASPLTQDAAVAEELADQADDLTALAERYASHTFSERDAKYQMQRSYNQKRGKLGYDKALTRRRGE